MLLFLSSAVSYCEENAQNGLTAALIRRPWHCDGPEGVVGLVLLLCCTGVSVRDIVVAAGSFGSDKN